MEQVILRAAQLACKIAEKRCDIKGLLFFGELRRQKKSQLREMQIEYRMLCDLLKIVAVKR